LYRFFPSWICFAVKRTNVPFCVVAVMRTFERFGMARTGYALGTGKKMSGIWRVKSRRHRCRRPPPPPVARRRLPRISCIGAPHYGLARHVNHISSSPLRHRCISAA
jgi:hypothetical protein